MKRLKGLDLIKAYRAHPEDFLPMLDHTEQMPRRNDNDEIDIGWYAGMLDERRPFFVECWAWEGITTITLLVSTTGIEDMTPEELDQWFQDIGYYKYKEDRHYPPTVDKFISGTDGNEYYTINVSVAVEDEPARIDGGLIIPWRVLNSYNSRNTI